MKRGSIFSDHAAFESRLILDEAELRTKIAALRALNLKIVLVSGSFDMAHIGHMRYLHLAREEGDVLVVGIDSDAKVRARKGKFRPIAPELERAEMVAHSRYVDIVTIKHDDSEKWSLIKLVCPDVLVISERTGYDEAVRQELAVYCKEIRNLPSQAETSTTAGVRRLQMDAIMPALATIKGAVDAIEKQYLGGGE